MTVSYFIDQMLDKENLMTPEERIFKEFELKFYKFLYGEKAQEMLQRTIEDFEKDRRYYKQMEDIDKYLQNWRKHVDPRL